MKKNDFYDGICDSCGNTGLAGERCSACGEVLSKIEPDINDPVVEDKLGGNEPETYPLEALDEQVSDNEENDLT